MPSYTVKTGYTTVDLDQPLGTHGVIGIKNSSAGVLTIRRISMLSPSTVQAPDVATLGFAAATFPPGLFSFGRITGVTGGIGLSFSEYDTASSSLPAQVVAVATPDSVAGFSVLRRCATVPGLQTAQTATGATGPGVANLNLGNPPEGDDIFSFNRMVASNERIILREGQGLAIAEAPFLPQAGGFGTVVVRVVATGATYAVDADSIGVTNPSLAANFAIMNGSGSGVTLEIVRVIFGKSLYGSSSGTFRPDATVRLIRTTGISGGRTLTPVKRDTTSADVLPDVEFTANPYVNPLGAASMPNTAMRMMEGMMAAGQQLFAVSPYLQALYVDGVNCLLTRNFPRLAAMRLNGQNRIIIYEAKSGAGLQIKSNDGLALCWGCDKDLNDTALISMPFYYSNSYSPMVHSNVDVMVDFEFEPTGGSSGGAGMAFIPDLAGT